MGIHLIKMPDIGEGIAEVELVEWHVQPGDTVVEDQVLADVMTDKATVQVPSPVNGTVESLGGKVGEVMAVGSALIRLQVEGAGNMAAASAKPARQPEAAPAVATHSDQAQAVAAVQPAHAAEAKPHAPTDKPGAAPRASASSGTTVVPAAARVQGEKPLASPAVRKRAWDLGIELQYVPATGSGGQITHHDLDGYLARGAKGTTAGSHIAAYAPREDEQQVAVIGLRRKIAEKMQESKRRIPHFTYVEEVDVTELEALRQRLNAQWGAERGKLTILPLLARAMVLALRDFPQINARYDDEAGVVTRYGAVHLGIAAQTESGLMVPVLRHAETLDLWACSAEIARLAEAARTGRAVRDELSGSTITLTSLGALGGVVSTPVINHPEVAIVGVNRMVERPVILGGAVVARKMMNLSSSFDHRVVDGMHAAEFIQKIRGYLECPAMLFVE
ncbi:dihydrolipoamide acetyltransferase family protein [Pollutimonas harenae]|uniref:Dihydrolipoamide acetyltransferase component of pyruvate dehydrogenase complex n=1 Tax=Pollutimonas harenae TaxID=657015 RepID=A0A853GZP1_9BURK|nr:dihydrolipoamide acetyltransferase family protein [Pollutimonas harenae]NYT86186.1 2-oxo acid dehydrogenase subunit E2 [Pollutimonas harenae]TEA71220.1 2-oxo acid dehydrogenase subunit E2 [Pollutimonas harenae]